MPYYGIRTSISDFKPEKKIKVKKQYKFKKKPTGEKIVFEMIASARKHKSFISGADLFDLRASNFAHVLPKAKNKYPEFKLNPKNIVLLTDDEHHEWDHGSREELKKMSEWQKMFELEAKLKEEYKEKHSTT